MNWSTCKSGSNNIHFDSPPIMMDGRNYADWLPGATINENIRKQANITNNWDYRQYLTHNADAIIKTNKLNACDECNACPFSYKNKSIKVPYTFTSCSDASQPFGYEDSDLKNEYLSRTELNSRLVTPVVSQDALYTNNYQNYN